MSGDSPTSIHRDAKYYFGPLITFQVEDTIFQVPRKEFEEQSEVFANMFTMPANQRAEEDGQSDEQPLHLEGITANEFRCFLRALFPRPALHYDEPETDAELAAALRLARMWNFNDFQKVLVKRLGSLDLALSRRLELARIYDIREWYKPGLRALALRGPSLTIDEGNQMGAELVTMLLILRDKRYKAVTGERSESDDDILNNIYADDLKWKIEKRIDRKLLKFSRDHHWDVPNI